MVDISPFRALRYSKEKVGELSKLIAPPYDVISPALHDTLYARHPNNIIRIDLAKTEPGEADEAKYPRAHATLDAWINAHVLVLDDAPSFYVLAQTFTGPDGVVRTRTGFFGRAKLTAWNAGPILPHERTLRGPKIDRLNLMRATHYNSSPVFAIYRDPHQRVLNALEDAKSEAPIAEAEMDHVMNRMWRIRFSKQHERVRTALAESKLYVADGHHRYETALAYKEERHAEQAKTGRIHGVQAPDNSTVLPPGYDYILMFSSAVDDPGMVIFPTHRLVHSSAAFDEAKLWKTLDPFFTRTEAPADAADAQRALREAGHRGNACLVATKSSRSLIVAKKAGPWDSVAQLPKHQALRTLDVAVLHSVIIEHALAISEEAQATQKNLRYSKDFTEAFTSPARDADVQAAFLMNPTKIEEVINVAEAGEVMPQKSTSFYPKIPSGLVLCPLD